MQSKLKKAIGTVKDQTSISLARVTSNKTNLEVAVLKATTHDDVPLDERRIGEILKLVSSDKANAALCARTIGKRIGRTKSWMVALKSLMLVLKIFQDGDPYFPREVLHAMKRGAKILNLSSFRADSTPNPWDYTAFIRTFALYLDERLDCFLTGKLQRKYTCKENDPAREMKPAMLLDNISYWTRLLDRAVATRPTGSARLNRLVQISLYNIVQETFDLYRDISDGLGLLLDRFFHLEYNSCVNAFQACVKATKQFEELSGFYDLCKSIGVGRTSEYPSVQMISEELIGTLQEFLKDQSSFPGRPPTSKGPLLLPAMSFAGDCPGKRQESFKNRGTHAPSTSSLEDLISATEITEPRSFISIDLEAYSITDHSGKGFLSMGSPNDDEGSTRSLPISGSLVDLVSLDAWSQNNQEQEQLNIDEVKTKTIASSSSLQVPDDPLFNPRLESKTSLPQQEAEISLSQEFLVGLDTLSNHEHGPEKTMESNPTKGWESVLAQSTDNLHFQNFIDSFPQNQSYNPFLQELGEATMPLPPSDGAVTSTELGFPVSDEFFGEAPTFQATPTFFVQNQSSGSSFVDEIDLFATVPTGDKTFSSPLNQQNLSQERELWLQQQNKIVSRHMA